jgi:hypothetical protein
MHTYSKSLAMVFTMGIITQGTLKAEGFWDRFKPTPEFLEKIGYRSEPRDYGNVPECGGASMFDLYQNQSQSPYREEQRKQKMIERAARSRRSEHSETAFPAMGHGTPFEEENFALRQTPGKGIREFEVSEDTFKMLPYKIGESCTTGGVAPGMIEPTMVEGSSSTAPCAFEGYMPTNPYPTEGYKCLDNSLAPYRPGSYRGIPYDIIKNNGRITLRRKTNALEDKLMSLDLEIRDLRDKQDEIRQELFTPQQYDY